MAKDHIKPTGERTQTSQGTPAQGLLQVARLLMRTREEVEKLNEVVNAFKEWLPPPGPGSTTGSGTAAAPGSPKGSGSGGDLAARIDRTLEQKLAEAVDSATTRIAEQIERRVSAALAKAGSGSAPGQPDAEAQMRLEEQVNELRDRLVKISDTIDRRLEPLSSALQELNSGPDRDRLEQQLDAVKAAIDAVPSAINAGIADGVPAAASAGNPGVLDDIERRLCDLRDHLVGLGSRLEAIPAEIDQRISEAMASVSFGLMPEESARHLNGLLDRVEQRVTGALDDLSTRRGPDPAQLAELQRSLAAVGEQVTTVLDRGIKTGDGKAGPDIDALLARAMADVQSRLEAVGQHLDERLAAGLAGLEARVSAAAAAPASGAGDAAVTAAAPPPAAAPGSPSKPRAAGELVNLLVEAINSDDDRVIRKFVSSEYADSALAEGSIDDRVEVYKSVYDETGEQRVVSFEENDRAVVAITQSRTSLNRLRFEVIRDPGSPHKILVVNIDDA